MTTKWTDERTELCKKLWISGKSASDIASRLGGTTRNAVIGRMHRIGVPRIDTKVAKEQRERMRRIAAGEGRRTRKLSKASSTPLQPLPLPEEGKRPAYLVSFDDLNASHCRYIYGDVQAKDYGYCGEKRIPGSAYCCAHHNLCNKGIPTKADYTPIRERNVAFRKELEEA